MKNMYKKIIYVILASIMIQGLGANGEVMRSLILPGWGELKMQENKKAKVFMGADLAIIATYLLGKSFNRWYIDRYTAYGTLHGDADMNGKNYTFIVNMSNYDSMEDYNHNMMIHHNSNYFDNIYPSNPFIKINKWKEAKEIIDIATLTGACSVALGDVAMAIIGNTQKNIDSFISGRLFSQEF
mgnify:CR=1 FL=1